MGVGCPRRDSCRPGRHQFGDTLQWQLVLRVVHLASTGWGSHNCWLFPYAFISNSALWVDSCGPTDRPIRIRSCCLGLCDSAGGVGGARGRRRHW